MTELVIRPAEFSDCKDLAVVFIEAFGIPTADKIELVEYITRSFETRIKNSISQFYIAHKDQVLGLGAETEYKGSSFIGYIGVLPKHWREGIGTKIFEYILEETKKHNPTIELFSNPGADSIYRRFGFVEEFQAPRLELTKAISNDKGNTQIIQDIPKWVFDLDKSVMGFDRSKILKFLIKEPETSLICYEEKGYAIVSKDKIGPLIANDTETALQLINYSLLNGKKIIIMPENKRTFLDQFIPDEKQYCIKMIHGKSTVNKPKLIWAYNSYATS